MKTKALKIVLIALLFVACQSVQSQNSNPSTPKEKREALLTPTYYTYFLGASFFTIPFVEQECDLDRLDVDKGIEGLTFFYNLSKGIVGMFTNNEDFVIVRMTMRLYSTVAEEFIHEAIEFGYKYVSDGTDINYRSSNYNPADVYYSNVKRYRKVIDDGTVYMEVATTPKYAGEYSITIYKAKEI